MKNALKKKKPTNPLFIDQKSKIKQTNEAKIDEEVGIEKAEVDAKCKVPATYLNTVVIATIESGLNSKREHVRAD